MINENKKRNILYIYIRIYRYILQVNIHTYVHTRAHERKYVGTSMREVREKYVRRTY